MLEDSGKIYKLSKSSKTNEGRYTYHAEIFRSNNSRELIDEKAAPSMVDLASAVVQAYRLNGKKDRIEVTSTPANIHEGKLREQVSIDELLTFYTEFRKLSK